MAYYRFTGAGVGSIFNVDQGQITFYLKSRYGFAQRQSSATSPRFAFDVREGGSGSHLFYFTTRVNAGSLLFSYAVGAGAQFYYVPKGSEESLFGNGVMMKVTIEWSGSVSKLYLNDALVQSSAYTKPAPNWTAASSLIVGGYDYAPYGAFNVSDDIIDEFTVATSLAPDTTSPTVGITAPANGATVNGTVTLTANATDNVGVTGVQFKLDGVNLGSAVTGAGPVYSYSWNTATAANGTHTLTAVASDAAGNTAVSASVSVTVNNDTTAPAVGMTAPANGATVNGTVTLAANATDNMGVTGVQFKLDGVNLGGAMTGAGPVYSYSWNTATAANGTHTLTVVAGDAAGNTTTSAAVSVTVNNVAADTTAPAVSMTAPANGASVNGTVTVTANATDNVGVTGVQFKLDGANLGSVVTGAGPAFSYSWNTATAANGIHTLTAVASDAAGNSASSGSVSVTVANNQPLVVSGVSVGAIGSSSAIISWATDRPADSQVAYGATASYGSLSPLAAGLVTSHTVTLGGLTPAHGVSLPGAVARRLGQRGQFGRPELHDDGGGSQLDGAADTGRSSRGEWDRGHAGRSAGGICRNADEARQRGRSITPPRTAATESTSRTVATTPTWPITASPEPGLAASSTWTRDRSPST